MNIVFNPFNVDSELDLNTNSNRKIHLRIKKRTNRQYKTFIEGLDSFQEEKDLETILKTLKKQLSCGGCIKNTVNEREGIDIKVIELSGDKRDQVRKVLTKEFGIKSDNIITHGF